MATEATIGALRVILGADIAQFADALTQAEKRFNKFESAIKKVGSALGVALGVGATVAAIQSTIDSLEKLNKVSQQVGMPVEQLSALKFAAGLADVELQALSQSMVRLAKNMAATAQGSAGPAADAFRALGIEVRKTDGTLKAQGDILNEIADAFQTYADSAEKTALAVAIFGRAGAQMIPLLNQGSQGLRDNAEQARRFGLVVDEQAAEAAEHFNDNLKRLGGAAEGLTISFVQGLLPSLIKLSDQMVDSAEKGTTLAATGEKIGKLIEHVTFVIRANVAAFTILGAGLNAVITALLQAAKGDLSGAWNTLTTATKQSGKTLEEFGEVFDDWYDNTVQGLDVKYRETEAWLNANRAMEKAAPALAEATKGYAQFIAKATEQKASLEAQIQSFGKSEGAIARAKYEAERYALALKEGKDPIDAQKYAIEGFGSAIETLTNRLVGLQRNQQFTETIRSLGLQAREAAGEFTGRLAPGFIQAAQSLKLIKDDGSNLEAILNLSTKEAVELNNALFKVAGNKLAADFLSPYDEWLLKIKAINAELEKHPEKQKLVQQATAQATSDMLVKYGQAAQGIVTPFASAFRDLAAINKKYAGLAKAAAIAEATVNTFVGATKAYAQTGIFGGPIAAAAVIAAGLALVAKIIATPMATGGSFKVPGGMSGVDSKFVPLMLSPGEQVDVTPSGRSRERATTVNITLQGDSVSRNAVRELFDTLNAGIADGYRIKLA